MRCIIGFALFVALYFGSCKVLGEATRRAAGPLAQAHVLKKYRALVAVGAGGVSLFICSLPTLVSRSRDIDDLCW